MFKNVSILSVSLLALLAASDSAFAGLGKRGESEDSEDRHVKRPRTGSVSSSQEQETVPEEERPQELLLPSQAEVSSRNEALPVDSLTVLPTIVWENIIGYLDMPSAQNLASTNKQMAQRFQKGGNLRTSVDIKILDGFQGEVDALKADCARLLPVQNDDSENNLEEDHSEDADFSYDLRIRIDNMVERLRKKEIPFPLLNCYLLKWQNDGKDIGSYFQIKMISLFPPSEERNAKALSFIEESEFFGDELEAALLLQDTHPEKHKLLKKICGDGDKHIREIPRIPQGFEIIALLRGAIAMSPDLPEREDTLMSLGTNWDLWNLTPSADSYILQALENISPVKSLEPLFSFTMEDDSYRFNKIKRRGLELLLERLPQMEGGRLWFVERLAQLPLEDLYSDVLNLRDQLLSDYVNDDSLPLILRYEVLLNLPQDMPGRNERLMPLFRELDGQVRSGDLSLDDKKELINLLSETLTYLPIVDEEKDWLISEYMAMSFVNADAL